MSRSNASYPRVLIGVSVCIAVGCVVLAEVDSRFSGTDLLRQRVGYCPDEYEDSRLQVEWQVRSLAAHGREWFSATETSPFRPLSFDDFVICTPTKPLHEFVGWIVPTWAGQREYVVVLPMQLGDPELPGMLAHEMCHAHRSSIRDPLIEVICEYYSIEAVRDIWGSDSPEFRENYEVTTSGPSRHRLRLAEQLAHILGSSGLAQLAAHGETCIALELWADEVSTDRVELVASVLGYEFSEMRRGRFIVEQNSIHVRQLESCAARHRKWALAVASR